MTRVLLMCLVALAACSDPVVEPDVTSETHWMQACVDGDACGDSGVCLCGVCTLPCDSDRDCEVAGPLSSCVPAGEEASDLVCGDAVSASLCLAPCLGDDTCADVGDNLTCSVDVCVPPDSEPDVCAGDADCSRGFCSKAPGSCDDDGVGVCQPRAEECTEEFAPVCGCDGQTYSNACAAMAVGVNVDSDGECAEPPAECLGNSDCAEQAFCRFPEADACGRILEFPGQCEPLPEGCDANFDPVCGCDFMTYGNACEAAMARVNVAAAGECGPANCGGFRGEQCDDGFYCHWSPDLMCGAADQTGVCLPVPEVCTDEEMPVCACDNNTYSNACQAHAESLSVLREGACE